MSTPVDVVIAVHSASRPIARAVASVLDAGASARALVVAHGLDPQLIIDNLGSQARDERVVVLPFADGIPSPAGPFAYGLRQATSDWVCVMGSDDTLDPGALDAAVERAETHGADAAILPMRDVAGVRVDAPLVRVPVRDILNPVADRLFARTAPLAVIRRTIVESLQPVFDPQYVTGEDIEFSSRLWSQARITYEPTAPGYVVHDDAADRVSAAGAADLVAAGAAPRDLAERSWVQELPVAVRRALATKMLRVHVLGPLRGRAALSTEEATAMAQIARVWTELEPRSVAPFPLTDRAILDAVLTGDATAILAARNASTRSGILARNLTRTPTQLFGRESVLRRYVLYARHARLRSRTPQKDSR